MARTVALVGPNGTVSRSPISSTATYYGPTVGSDASTSWLGTDTGGSNYVDITHTTNFQTTGSAIATIPISAKIISIGLRFAIKNNTDHLWTGTANIFWNDTAPFGSYTYRGNYVNQKFWSILPNTIAPGYVEYSVHWGQDSGEVYRLLGGQTMANADIISAINGGYNTFQLALDFNAEFVGGPVNDFQLSYFVMTVEYGTDDPSGDSVIFQYLSSASDEGIRVAQTEIGTGAILATSPGSDLGTCWQFPGTRLPDGSFLFRHDPSVTTNYDWYKLSSDLSTWTTIPGTTDAVLRSELLKDGAIVAYNNTSVLFFANASPGTDIYWIDFTTWSYSLLTSLPADSAQGTGYRCPSKPLGGLIYMADNAGAVRSFDVNLDNILLYQEPSPMQCVYSSPSLKDCFDTVNGSIYADGYLWAAISDTRSFISTLDPMAFLAKIDPSTKNVVAAYFAPDDRVLQGTEINTTTVGDYLVFGDFEGSFDLVRFDMSLKSFREYFLFDSGNAPTNMSGNPYILNSGFSYPSSASARFNESFFSSPANRRTIG